MPSTPFDYLYEIVLVIPFLLQLRSEGPLFWKQILNEFEFELEVATSSEEFMTICPKLLTCAALVLAVRAVDVEDQETVSFSDDVEDVLFAPPPGSSSSPPSSPSPFSYLSSNSTLQDREVREKDVSMENIVKACLTHCLALTSVRFSRCKSMLGLY